MSAKAKEDLPDNLPLSYPSPLPSELDLSSEPHASNELVDFPEDFPLSRHRRETRANATQETRGPS